jgi:RNA polymerase sigma factor (TIGR02999 family)
MDTSRSLVERIPESLEHDRLGVDPGISVQSPPRTDVAGQDSTADQSGRESSENLLPLVYEELRRLAIFWLKYESPGHTLQPTALVHEAYLRLVDVEDVPLWDSRRHFFAAAATAMRRILVEEARRKSRLKRGGALRRVDLVDKAAADPDRDLVALDEALDRLAIEDPLAARVVELRQFAGMGHEEVAATLEITVYLARQKWTYARAWLRVALGP